MLKAYVCAETTEDFQEQVIWAETAGQAKAGFASDLEMSFIAIHVHRLKWADEFGCIDNIPYALLLKKGWTLVCDSCMCHITEDDDYDIEGDSIYCRECYEKRQSNDL